MLPEVKIDKKNFHKLDLSQLPTPCYVIDLNIVKQNLQLLRKNIAKELLMTFSN